HKESSKGSVRNADGLPGLSWQIRPLRHAGPHVVVDGDRGSLCTQSAPGARRGQFWHRRPISPKTGTSGRRRRTWTHISAEGRPRGAHAVEFSKTVAPLRKGLPSSRRTRERTCRSLADRGV